MGFVLNSWNLVESCVVFQNEKNDFQKVDLLIEFCQWLYCNEFPVDDAIDQLEWAIDILLNMKTEIPKLEMEKPQSTGTDTFALFLLQKFPITQRWNKIIDL